VGQKLGGGGVLGPWGGVLGGGGVCGVPRPAARALWRSWLRRAVCSGGGLRGVRLDWGGGGGGYPRVLLGGGVPVLWFAFLFLAASWAVSRGPLRAGHLGEYTAGGAGVGSAARSSWGLVSTFAKELLRGGDRCSSSYPPPLRLQP